MTTPIAAATEKATRTSEKIAEPIGDLAGWFAANIDGLAVGAAVAAGFVGLMLLLRRLGRRILASNPDCNSWRGVIASVLARTNMLFMVAAAIRLVTASTDVPARLDRATGVLFTIAAAIQAAIWARELILGAVRSRVGEEPGESTLGNAMSIIRVLVSVLAFGLAAIAILDNLGVNVTTLVAGLGIGGIAIGLAAQGIFADLFAALAIVFDRPFRRGDTIRYGGAAGTIGTVERIGLKTTRLRAISGEQVVMANTKLLEQELTNVAESTVRRVWVPFGLVYQTPADTLADLPRLVDEVIKPIKHLRLVRCVATAYGASSIDCELVYDHRSNDADEIARARSQVIIGVKRLFAREKIEFAYPTQTTYTAAPDGTLVMPWAPPPAPPAPPA